MVIEVRAGDDHDASLPDVPVVLPLLVLMGVFASGCGGDDSGDPSAAQESSTPASSSPSEGSASPTADEALIDEAFADAITTCDRLLLTPGQVRQVLGVPVQAPAPLKAAGVVFGCEYATRNMAQGGGQTRH